MKLWNHIVSKLFSNKKLVWIRLSPTMVDGNKYRYYFKVFLSRRQDQII